MVSKPPIDERIVASFLAGSIAITVNTGLLALADMFGLVTAHGGLLKLIRPPIGAVLVLILPAFGLETESLNSIDTAMMRVGFHVLVGLLMAFAYGVVLAGSLPGPPWFKGMTYAVFVWVLNTLIVLPAISGGIAGARTISLPGILYFATAHLIFFEILSLLYPLCLRDEDVLSRLE